MKKVSQYIGLGFYGLILLAMTLAVISDLIRVFDMIYYKADGYNWLIMLDYTAQATLTFFVALFAGLVIIKGIGNDDTYDNKSVLAVPFLAACAYVLKFLIYCIYSLAHNNSYFDGKMIAVLMLNIAIIVLALIGYSLFRVDRYKGFSIVLITLFLSLVSTIVAFGGSTIEVFIDLFVLFGTMAAIAYVITSNLDVLKQASQNNSDED